MITLTFKIDLAMQKEMDNVMMLYSTKTEFIRAAIREKIEKEKVKLFVEKNFRSFQGRRLTQKERAALADELFQLKNV